MDKPVRLAISRCMITFVAILTGLAMLGTLGTLFAGMLGLVRGSGNPGRSNALMRWRVMLQGASLALFVLLLSLMRT
ncbi:MAG: twin transmembrane helix small protein [Janthinobacterium lividum]